MPNREAPYGQPPVMLEEFIKCEAVVKADPGWRAAMHRRGLTDKDIELVQVDPFSSGFFDMEFERGAASSAPSASFASISRTTAMLIRSKAWSPSST